jgi:hypothetical protein
VINPVYCLHIIFQALVYYHDTKTEQQNIDTGYKKPLAFLQILILRNLFFGLD